MSCRKGAEKTQAQLLVTGTKVGFPTLHPERLKVGVLETTPSPVPDLILYLPHPTVTLQPE